MLKDFSKIITGAALCLIIAIAATFVSGYIQVPVMMLALLFGMILHFMSKNELTKDGVQFTSRSILRIGVALIGARIAISDFTSLGVSVIAFIIAVTILIIILGILLAKIFGADKEQGILIGGATAICGASAALAISATMKNSKSLEQNTLIAVIGVTSIGTIAMITYPLIINMLGLNDYEAGILIGGAIHDVAQVVGAGYSVSEEAGDSAIIIKLIRVSMLVPILFVFALMFKGQETSKSPAIPLFIIGFIVLVILNSLQLIPAQINYILKDISKYMLIMAIAAVGIKTSFKSLLSLGWKPIALIAIETIVIFGIYFMALSVNFLA